jgi:hypothetical protein
VEVYTDSWTGEIYETKLEFDYDLSVNLEDIYFGFSGFLAETFSGINIMVNKPLEIIISERWDGEWEEEEVMTFHYSTPTNLRKPAVASGIEVSVYPNPSSGLVHVTVEAGAVNPVMEMYDLTGRMVFHTELQAGEANEVTFSLAPGMYIYRVVSAGSQSKGKIIVE